MTSLSVSDCGLVTKEEVGLKGPLPLPLEVALLSTVPEAVALMR